jgi:hypothetical protein
MELFTTPPRKPISTTPGSRVRAFKGPNAGRTGTVIANKGNEIVTIRWDK